MATTNAFMDGKSLKAFVENDKSWKAYVDEKFATLDKSHTGKLTHTELQPAIAAVGNALGLPPMGESPETDHIYTEVGDLTPSPPPPPPHTCTRLSKHRCWSRER
jgi:hypothetical protein